VLAALQRGPSPAAEHPADIVATLITDRLVVVDGDDLRLP
jgi:hypothetical protein